jgi:hypothetical protein
MWTIKHIRTRPLTRRHSTNFKTQGTYMQGGLRDDATYPVTRMGSMSFCMPSGDVLDIDDVLYVLVLMKNLISVSTMIDLRSMSELTIKLSEIAARILVEFWL